MQRRQWFPFALLVTWTLGGCGSPETADQIAKLQEQIGRIAQQLSETKKQVDGLQEANQRSVRSLENLEATVASLTAVPAAANAAKAAKGGVATTGGRSQDQSQFPFPSGKSGQKPFTEQDIEPSSSRTPHDVLVATVAPFVSSTTGEGSASAERHESTVTAVSCGQVWKLIGQGKSLEVAARALGVSVAAIQACEQKVGRTSGSR